MILTIDTRNLATPALAALDKKLSDPKRVNTVVANAALPALQNKLRSNAATNKNKFGARGSFWNRILSSTLAIGTENAAILRMPGEMNLRVHGGTVTPKTTKYLAIPAVKEAYGKSPRDFSDLRFAPLFGKGNGGALIQRDQQRVSFKKDGTTARGKKLGGKVYYWLKPSATIQGDSTLLPTETELLGPAIEGIKSYLSL